MCTSNCCPLPVSAPLKSVLDFHKEQMKAQKHGLKTEDRWYLQNREGGLNIPKSVVHKTPEGEALKKGMKEGRE